MTWYTGQLYHETNIDLKLSTASGCLKKFQRVTDRRNAQEKDIAQVDMSPQKKVKKTSLIAKDTRLLEMSMPFAMLSLEHFEYFLSFFDSS